MPAGHVTDQTFEQEVLKSDTPVLVDFFATWCGPCKMAAPVLDKLADEYNGKVKIVKLDVDENQMTSGKYGVMSIPTVVLFEKGQEKQRKVGFGGEQGYRTLLSTVSGT